MKRVESGKGPRRVSGEAPARADDLEAALNALTSRSTPELRREWCELHHAEAPSRLSRDLLLRGVAYRLQERVHGGLSIASKRRLAALAKVVEAKGSVPVDPAPLLKPGTRLLREWHGRSHAVLVLENGFEYAGERYASLTRIASLITGAHWSGPVFFGLKQRTGNAAHG